MNIQGMSPSADTHSRWKLPYFREHYLSDAETSIPYIAFTETWLKPFISDIQVSIPNYNLVRSDRIKRERGGVILYIHETLPLSDTATFDNDYCEAVITTIETTETILACIYRPPDAPPQKFKEMISFLDSYIKEKTSDQYYEIIITGDFNLPSIDWNTTSSMTKSQTTDSSKNHQTLLTFLSDHLLSQYIHIPTRYDNILDLLFSNNPNLVLHVNSNKTELSDHNVVTVTTTTPLEYQESHAPDDIHHTFRNINLEKMDYAKAKEHLEIVDWKTLKTVCPKEDFPELFRLTVLQICTIYSPPLKEKKASPKINFVPKERRLLHRKKTKTKEKDQQNKSKITTF